MTDFFSVTRLVYESSTSLETSACQAGLPYVSNFFNAPGTYSYPPGYVTNGKFTLVDPGLHLVQAIYSYGTNPIFNDGGYALCWQPSWNNDYSKVLALMSAFAWMTVDGIDDNSLTDAQLKTKFRTTRLTLTCEPTTIFAHARLAEVGITSRAVSLAAPQDHNGFDDTHSIIEVLVNGQWCLFDLSLGYAFQDASGNPLSLRDVITTGFANVPQKVDLGGGECNPTNGWKSNGAFIYDIYYNSVIRYGAAAWAERMYQIPGIANSDGNVYFYLPPGTESAETWLLAQSSNWKVLSQADWDAKNYP